MVLLTQIHQGEKRQIKVQISTDIILLFLKMYLLWLFSLKRPKSNVNPMAVSTPNDQIIVSKCKFPTKRNQSSLEK